MRLLRMHDMKSDKTVCVFTPTYNRAYILGTLYQSLCAQTSFDFMWFVVDDGSTDNTEELVGEFEKAAPFDVRYLKVSNGGKQRAHDLAVSLCENELFFCVDSDDHLTPDAIQTVVSAWGEVRERDDIAGILALHGTSERDPIGSWMPSDVTFSTQHALYERYGFKGDISLIYRTDVLREFPFDVEPGEKFIPETYSYFQIDRCYSCLLVNKIIKIGDYLPDGYSSAFPKNVLSNPRSYLKHKRLCMEMSTGLYNRFYDTAMFMVAHYVAKGSYGLGECTSVAMGALALIPAVILAHTKFKA